MTFLRALRRGGKKAARLILPALLLAGASRGEDVVRLRAIDPKPSYHPGDVIAVEMVCAPGMTDEAVVLSGPGGEASNPLPRCPHARFEIRIPRDFVGRSTVSVVVRRGDLHADLFSFKVRSDFPPKDLFFSSSGERMDPKTCSAFWFDPHGPVALSVQLAAEQPDGKMFDLCKGADVRVTTDPPESFRFDVNDRGCGITAMREGSFKLAVAYGGLRKEWNCEAKSLYPEISEKPTATPVPRGPRIATADFISDPSRLERNGAVGECRLTEHWDTGYCYVFSRIRGQKVSEATDVRCDDLAALRERMAKAVQRGDCESRPAGETPKISIQAFRSDPLKLDHHPMDVGGCRLVEHHTTGYCYIYSLNESRKVSEYTDVRCDDLAELRKRMNRAIEGSHCN